MKEFAIALLLLAGLSFGVPAIPQHAEIEGEVVVYSVIRAEVVNVYPKDMVLYELVLKPKDNRKYRRSVRGYVQILSKKPIAEWFFGRDVRIRAIYRGDERGGAYWLIKVLEVR